MSDKQKGMPETRGQRVALTAHLSLEAYHAITTIQQQHRIKTGRALPIWKVLDCQLSDETGSAALYVIRLIELAKPVDLARVLPGSDTNCR